MGENVDAGAPVAESSDRKALRRRVKEDLVRDATVLGYTTAEIAAGLEVSEATVDRIRARTNLRDLQRQLMQAAREELGGRPTVRG